MFKWYKLTLNKVVMNKMWNTDVVAFCSTSRWELWNCR